jgi:uncharacterized protein (TIGR02301 family)
VKRRAALLAGVVAAFAAAQGAPAQQPRAPQPPAAPQAPEPEAAPLYEPQLLRLAEIMGALARLRDLCGQKDGEDWRRRMAALTQTEGVTTQRRERLAGAFNRGFRGFEQTYRRCTPAAQALIDRYVAEGAKLSRDLANRFAG